MLHILSTTCKCEMTRDSFFRLEDESVEMEPDVGGPAKSLLLSWPGIVCEVILVTFKLAFLVTLSLTLAVLTYVLTRYLDVKPIGKHTVIDSVMRDMFMSSMVRQVSVELAMRASTS